MIRLAVVGCGVMGGHHARTVARDPRCRLVAVVDVHPQRAERLAAEVGCRASLEIPDVDAVIDATPTGAHVAVAAPLVARGRWCLVEKPLAASSADGLRLRADRVFVGHSERFNPAVRAVGPLRPRRIVAVRQGPPGRRSDVDVVRDLMVHDLDLAAWWTGEADPVVVDAVQAPGDAVRARLRFGGVDVDLFASRSADVRLRTITADDVALDLVAGRATRGGVGLATPDPRDALEAQLDAFLAAIDGRPSAPLADADAGLVALRAAERIHEALRDTGRA